MAGYARELLQDFSTFGTEHTEAGSEFHVTKIDLYSTLEKLYKEGVLSNRHILALNLYFSGNHRAELLAVEGSRELLSFALKQVEYYAGTEYSDEYFVDRALTKYPNYGTMKHVFVRRLIELGDKFELA